MYFHKNLHGVRLVGHPVLYINQYHDICNYHSTNTATVIKLVLLFVLKFKNQYQRFSSGVSKLWPMGHIRPATPFHLDHAKF